MISIANSADFGKLITALSSDIVNAHVHWRLHCDLYKAIQAHPKVWEQSRTFWHLTLTAHAETAVVHLCRAFDDNKSALHLQSWLKTIRENLHIFEISEFKLRLADNAYVDSLAEKPRSPDLAILEADISDCATTDPLVRKLIIHRGNAVAHRNAKLAISGNSLPHELMLFDEDFEVLLLRAQTVLNRYCNLFAAETYSVNMLGRNDFKFIFSSVATAVEASLGEG